MTDAEVVALTDKFSTLSRDHRELRERVEELRIDVAKLSVRVGMYAAGGSILGGSIASVIVSKVLAG